MGLYSLYILPILGYLGYIVLSRRRTSPVDRSRGRRRSFALAGLGCRLKRAGMLPPRGASATYRAISK